MREEGEPAQHDPRAEHARQHGQQQALDQRALHERGVEGVSIAAQPPAGEAVDQRARVGRDRLDVGGAVSSPAGRACRPTAAGRPSAPVSRAIASSTFALTELSAKIALHALLADRLHELRGLAGRRLPARGERRDHGADHVDAVAPRVVAERVVRGHQLALRRRDLGRCRRRRRGRARAAGRCRRGAVDAERRARARRGRGESRCAGPATSAGRRPAGGTWSLSVTTGAPEPGALDRLLQPLVDVAARAHDEVGVGQRLEVVRARPRSRAGRRSARAARPPRPRPPPTLRARSAAWVVVATTSRRGPSSRSPRRRRRDRPRRATAASEQQAMTSRASIDRASLLKIILVRIRRYHPPVGHFDLDRARASRALARRPPRRRRPRGGALRCSRGRTAA